MSTQGDTLIREHWKLTAKGAILSPGKCDFTVYFATFEILMFFEKFATFYLKQLLKNVWLSCPAQLAGITESMSTVQQDI